MYVKSRKNEESVGMSSALGGSPRYQGVSNYIKYARHESIDRSQQPDFVGMRGPCPVRYLSNNPSNPIIMKNDYMQSN